MLRPRQGPHLEPFSKRPPEPDTPLSHYPSRFHKDGSTSSDSNPPTLFDLSMDENAGASGSPSFEKRSRSDSAASLSGLGIVRRRGEKLPTLGLSELNGMPLSGGRKALGRASELSKAVLLLVIVLMEGLGLSVRAWIVIFVVFGFILITRSLSREYPNVQSPWISANHRFHFNHVTLQILTHIIFKSTPPHSSVAIISTVHRLIPRHSTFVQSLAPTIPSLRDAVSMSCSNLDYIWERVRGFKECCRRL